MSFEIAIDLADNDPEDLVEKTTADFFFRRGMEYAKKYAESAEVPVTVQVTIPTSFQK